MVEGLEAIDGKENNRLSSIPCSVLAFILYNAYIVLHAIIDYNPHGDKTNWILERHCKFNTVFRFQPKPQEYVPVSG